ncbi:MAG TPA: hypothetical protein VF787_06560 [Thermoanaerobaculia bacterium]
MSEFDERWKAAVRFRKASRELEPLLHGVFDSMTDDATLRVALERLLEFLASSAGRTDANCSTTYYFITSTEERWRGSRDELHAILDDMSGTLQDSIYAPDIARTFESTPEQLLTRVRGVNS